MLTKLKELRNNNAEEGFTLIELMIVVVIIGILAAIAIPVFANQQKAAIEAGIKSDIKNTNTNIASALVKVPTAAIVTGNGTGATIKGIASPTSVGVTNPTVGQTTTSIPGATLFDIVISDSATRINVVGAWNSYNIVATNDTVNEDAEWRFNPSTGKIVFEED